MKLEEIINKKEIITVIGAGGKTSLINYFAKNIKDKKILLTTTTKIYIPPKEIYDGMYIESINSYEKNNNERVVVVGKDINEDNKIVSIDFDHLDKIKNDFDVILIEGDGSKKKSLKGWNEGEPVIYTYTDKVIGVLDITSYNMDVNDENIHRLNELKKITNIDKKISIENLRDVVLSKKGMFKNTKCEKILFINKVENNEQLDVSRKLIKSINKRKHSISIFYGSISSGKIYKA